MNIIYEDSSSSDSEASTPAPPALESRESLLRSICKLKEELMTSKRRHLRLHGMWTGEREQRLLIQRKVERLRACVNPGAVRPKPYSIFGTCALCSVYFANVVPLSCSCIVCPKCIIGYEECPRCCSLMAPTSRVEVAHMLELVYQSVASMHSEVAPRD